MRRVLRRATGLATLSLVLAVIVGVGVSPPSQVSASVATSAWTVAASPAHQWSSVLYADGRFVALGADGTVGYATSPATWATHALPAGTWRAVTFGNGRFVALSGTGTAPHELTSSNGISWVPQAGPPGNWTGIAFGNGRFVAVNADGQLVTSTDAVHWDLEFQHSKVHFTAVAYGNGRFIAVDGAAGATLVSLNGVGWSYYPTPAPGLTWGSVTYGNGLFVALDGAGSGVIATSVLGYVWTLHHYAPAQSVDAATFGCNRFIAVGSPANGGTNVLSSVSGSQWSGATLPSDPTGTFTGITYGAHRFVAVGTTGEIAWTPSPPVCSSSPPTAPQQVSGNVHNGEVWTYMHPPMGRGGAPVDYYRVTITNGTVTKQCLAPVYFEPNCIIQGLRNGSVYSVTAQSHNRYGFSVASDPEFVLPEAVWSLAAVSTMAQVPATSPITVHLTGVIANSEGIYPESPVTVHVGTQTMTCTPNEFGECIVTFANPGVGRYAIGASYTGYGQFYRSPTTYVTVTAN